MTKVSNIDIAHFIENSNQYIEASNPIVIDNYVNTMPAYSKWDEEYLLSTLNNKVVPVENYATATSLQNVPVEHLPFSEFLSSINTDQSTYYIAQCNILEDFNELANDISIPTFIKKVPHVNLYYGAKDLGTSLHFDFNDNIYCQIRGKKRFILVDPKLKDSFNFHEEKNWAHFSKDDYTQKLSSIPHHNIELNPGDALFIPYGWLHEVTNISKTLSISIWW